MTEHSSSSSAMSEFPFAAMAQGNRRFISVMLSLWVFTILLSGCSKQAAETDEEEGERIATVDSAPVVNGPIEKVITASAVLFPIQQATIIPKISATVKQFHVDRGSRVREGQLLAELENRDLAAAVAESNAGLAEAQAAYQVASRGTLPEDLQKAELEVKAAKGLMDAQQKVYTSRSSLLKEGAIAEREVDDALVSLTQARNQFEIASKHLQSLQGFGNEQQLAAAKAQLEAAQARNQNAETQLNYSRIVSPIEGIVTDRPLFTGEMASNSAPMLTVMDSSKVTARAHIAQTEAAQLKLGNDALITVPGQQGSLSGKVTVISPAVDPESTTVEIWVQAANPQLLFKPGSSARIEITSESVANALLIPAAALLTADNGSNSVFVIDAENTPHKKSVSVGIRHGEEVQVLEGVQSGDRVVTDGAFELSRLDPEILEKTKVQIGSAKEEEEDEDDAK